MLEIELSSNDRSDPAVKRARTRSVLVLCPTHRDYRELARINTDDRFVFHDYASVALEHMLTNSSERIPPVEDPIRETERVVTRYGGEIGAVISTDDYPGSALACMVAHTLGLPAPNPTVNLVCQHKHHSRALQKRIVPEAVPWFTLLNVDKPEIPATFPVFVKPVKSFFSIGAKFVTSSSELIEMCRYWTSLDNFFRPIDRLLEHVLGLRVGCNRLIAESVLRGHQVTVEGFVFRGTVTILGIVDSILFPGTLAFERFQYPSRLPGLIQQRMADVVRRLMQGFGYDNGMFNVEMIYDEVTDRIFIVEINPRMASQFADLYEKVDGINSYKILLDIALGRRPQLERGTGKHKVAASCVLRTFEDKFVASLPTKMECNAVTERHPDARIEILAMAGSRLSTEMQDGYSFRYGIISLGGKNEEDIRTALSDCLHRLRFSLLPIGNLSGTDAEDTLVVQQASR